MVEFGVLEVERRTGSLLTLRRVRTDSDMAVLVSGKCLAVSSRIESIPPKLPIESNREAPAKTMAGFLRPAVARPPTLPAISHQQATDQPPPTSTTNTNHDVLMIGTSSSIIAIAY